MRVLALLLSSVLLAPALGVAAPTRWPAVSYDTRGASHAEVEALKALVDAGFWLETGDALLVAAPAAVHGQLARRATAAAGHGDLAIEELALLPMGCDVDRHEIPDPIAVIGRRALVRMPAALIARAAGAQAVRANSVLAREFRAEDKLLRVVDPAIGRVVDRVDTARWFSRVETLAGYDRSSFSAGTGAGIDLARDWLVGNFQALGMATSTPSFNGNGFVAQNVIAVRPGTDLPGEWVLVGGHYDSRNTNNSSSGVANTPGAEDNASGCAGVLEMASIFATVPTRRTLVFACYAGEEQGLYGSLAHMQALLASGDLPRIKLAVIMDMIGFSGDADLDILLESGSNATQVGVLNTFAQLAADYAPGSTTVIDTNPCCSDHMPWINQGVPTLLTIENDWAAYPHYHRSTDLPQNMTNAQPMAGKILRTNAAGIATWAQLVDADLLIDGFE